MPTPATPLTHKERMAQRRAEQLARKSTTFVTTRPKLRALVADHRANIAAQNKERKLAGERPLSDRLPSQNIIVTGKYTPHQGKRECERRLARMQASELPAVEYREAA
jgi:hypothetical protein